MKNLVARCSAAHQSTVIFSSDIHELICVHTAWKLIILCLLLVYKTTSFVAYSSKILHQQWLIENKKTFLLYSTERFLLVTFLSKQTFWTSPSQWFLEWCCKLFGSGDTGLRTLHILFNHHVLYIFIF